MNGLALEPGLTGGNFSEAIDQHLRFHLARQDAMRSAAEQLERELFVRRGCYDHDLQLRRLAQKFGYGFDRIRSERGFKNQNVGGELGHGRLRLRQRLGLAHNPDIVFERKDLPEAGAENSLGIGQDHADETAAAALLVNTVIFSHADRSAGHWFPYALRPLEMVFVDDDPNPATALVFKTPNHAAVAVNLHIAS